MKAKKCYRLLGIILAATVAFTNVNVAYAAEYDTDSVAEYPEEQASVEAEEAASEAEEEALEEASDDIQTAAETEEQQEAAVSDAEESPQKGDHANSFRYSDGKLITSDNTASHRAYVQYTTWPEVDGAVAKGIDVSQHQGSIDWQKVKNAGTDYAIIRCGYGNDETNQDDKYWKTNADACVQNGIPFGTYIYSYAENTEMAESEANHVLRLVKGYKMKYPIYYDLEDQSILDATESDPKKIAEIAETFCNIIESAGYEVAIYANTNWFNNYLTDSRFDSWGKWVAQYNDSCTYGGKYTMWQCSSTGQVDGISGNVDLNIDYGTVPEEATLGVSYQAHVQDIGWQNVKYNGDTAGTIGQSKRVEALKLTLNNPTDVQGGLKYRVHQQDHGTLDWVNSGEIAGRTGESRRIEAIQIALTGELAEQYDIYYRVHVQEGGWLKWVKGSEDSSAWTGTEGLGLRIEAIQIQLAEKGNTSHNDSAKYSYITSANGAGVEYSGHQQHYGDLASVANGASLGVIGESLRLEALNASLLTSDTSLSGGIRYRSHIQDIGWESGWTSGGNMTGTSGKSKRLEAVQIQLTGDLATYFSVWYRVHVENYGWLGWARDGQTAGTEGISYRIESIEVKIVPKGGAAPGPNSNYSKNVPVK